jgi:uncharacterized ferredoxin-like protein
MINEEDIRQETIMSVAQKMAIAARTAPKARGTDNLIIRICEKEDIEKISKQLVLDYKHSGEKEAFLLRDSANILNASCLLLIATKVQVLGLDCGYCGYKTCKDKVEAGKNIPCFFNSEDLGLAVGSACSIAADNRVDNRVMFSAGRAASRLGMVEGCTQCLAICLSASAKNPFFDRK